MENGRYSSSSSSVQMSVEVLMMLNSTSTTPGAGAGAGPGSGDLNLSQPQDNLTTLLIPSSRLPSHRGPPPVPDPFLVTMSKVHYYSDPVIFTLGMVGNLLAYLVFTRSKFRKVPSVPYLAGIAVADSGFVFTCFLTTLTYAFRLPIMSQMGVCQFGTFANYVCLFLAMWYVVAVVVEKFISVYWPLKKVSLCTVFRAKVVLVSLTVLAIVSYSYVIYFFGPSPTYGLCGPWQEFQHPYKTFMVLDCIVVFIAPLLVIVVLVLLIVVRGCEYYRISSSTDFGPRVTSPQTTLRATELVFALVGLVIVTHLPNSVMRIVGLFNTRMDLASKQVFMRCMSAVRYVHLLSFAVKFPVYWVVSKGFREHSQRLLCGGKDRILALCDCETSNEADPQRIILRGCGGQGQPAANACLLQSDV